MRVVSLIVCVLISVQGQQQKAFVNPQSDCRIQCLNGGFCAYLVDNPSVHTCLCLLDMFYGERCQYQVVPTSNAPPATVPTTATTTIFEALEYPEGDTEYDEKPPADVVKPKHQSDEMEEDGDEDYTEGWDSVEDYGNEEDPTKPDRKKANEIKEHRQTDDMVDHAESDSRMHEESYDTTDDEGHYKEGGAVNSINTDDGDAGFYEHILPSESTPFDISMGQRSRDAHRDHYGHDGRYSSLEEGLADDSVARMPPSSHADSGERTMDTSTERGLIPESEAEDDGWMMSKRRRLANSGHSTATPRAAQQILLLLIGAFGFLRWTHAPF